ncbi:MAG: prolyl-tRNA synthetase associated domain-containing protein [Rhizomicrobium sp.]
MTMLSSPDTREAALYARLRELGIAWKTYEHQAVFTVEEASALYGGQPGGHSKNLFLKDKKDGLWLVTLRDALRVDLNALSKVLGAPRFSFGSAELLVATLGIEPGSVTPFSVMNDPAGKVRLVLDAGLLALEPLNFHPLRNDRTTAVAAADLLKFARAGGHEPVITDIPERA